MALLISARHGVQASRTENSTFIPLGDDGKALSKSYYAWEEEFEQAALLQLRMEQEARNTSVDYRRLLFKRYESMEPPLTSLVDGRAPLEHVDVYVFFEQLALLDVDEKAQQVHLKLHAVLFWLDWRLVAPTTLLVKPSKVVFFEMPPILK